MTLSRINTFSGENEGATSMQPSAPALEGAVEGAATVAPKNNFEWNLGRLYSDQEGHSSLRTWTVRILSTALVFPVVLTALVDIGRRIAFSFGAIDGKSWSLIDLATGKCKEMAAKADSAYKNFSLDNPISTEDLNRKSIKAIQTHAKELVKGYKDLNGGFFGNASFSSPAALKAEHTIAKAQADLINDIKIYAARNAASTEEFVQNLEAVQSLVKHEIDQAAKEALFVVNKIYRNGPPRKVRDVALEEFVKVQRETKGYAPYFVDFAKQEPQFVERLVNGINVGLLTETQAKGAIVTQADSSYKKGLETGVTTARRELRNILETAVESNLITEREAEVISDSVRPTVEKLAEAAAKDVVRKATLSTVLKSEEGATYNAYVPVVGEEAVPGQLPSPTNFQVKMELTQIADVLQAEKKLQAEDVTEFLTTAEMQLTKAKEAVDAEILKAQNDAVAAAKMKADEELRIKEEAEAFEAQKAAEVQKAANQASLLGKFVNLLELISKKQAEQASQFVKFDGLEMTRKSVTDRLEVISTTKVRVLNRDMTILDAAREYYGAVTEISNSNQSPIAKQQKVKDLANQGFSQQTIDKIKELEALEPQLTAVLDQQAELSKDINRRHEELMTLQAQYKVYKKNNFTFLEESNQKTVLETEKNVKSAQKALNRKHDELALAGLGFIARLKQDPFQPVIAIDAEGNRAEVERLVEEFERSQAPAEEVQEKKSTYGQAIYNGLAYPVRALKSLWNRK